MTIKEKIELLVETAKNNGEKAISITGLGCDQCHVYPRSIYFASFLATLFGLIWYLTTWVLALIVLLLFMFGWFLLADEGLTTPGMLKGKAKEARNICKLLGLKSYVHHFGYYGDHAMLMASFDGKRHDPTDRSVKFGEALNVCD